MEFKKSAFRNHIRKLSKYGEITYKEVRLAKCLIITMKKKSSPLHIIVKISEIPHKDRFLKAVREKKKKSLTKVNPLGL